MDQRPLVELQVNGKAILGLLDTGADRSIVALKDWPKGWPVQSSSQTLQGLGYAKTPDMSARELPWKDHEGHGGRFQPYVLELPVSLWGRELLKDMNYRLTNKGYSLPSQRMMQDMGWYPSKGLGKHLQGRTQPIENVPRNDRKGLGFS
ncbi:endogenous retrovirus group K member 7 Pro protein-like [Arvicanthis niloticus]|uniref:endogenous retrovirus group K member 7 Pro protein-like n=1 Tax=Arvicanthis niloticus TaxID=61156 RepID=UPI001485E9E8|nr:endogenous retrovirus group K member 7 Pro protein-like [Arvicanthis niloticus]